jgi:hypothetical protein
VHFNLNNMTQHQPILCLLAFFAIFLFSLACSDQPTDTISSTALVNSLEEDNNLLMTYRTATNDTHTLPTFRVVYEGNLERLLAEGGAMDEIVEAHSLVVQHSFEVDEAYQGIVFKARFPLDDAVQLGKVLSLVEQVMMVEVGNAQKDPLEAVM